MHTSKISLGSLRRKAHPWHLVDGLGPVLVFHNLHGWRQVSRTACLRFAIFNTKIAVLHRAPVTQTAHTFSTQSPASLRGSCDRDTASSSFHCSCCSVLHPVSRILHSRVFSHNISFDILFHNDENFL